MLPSFLLTYSLTYPVSNLLSGAYGQISYCYENTKTNTVGEWNASELIYVGRKQKEQYTGTDEWCGRGRTWGQDINQVDRELVEHIFQAC